MDWLNRARQFVGNLFGGAQRTIGQISGNVARAVGQAEQQAARTAQQVVRQIPQPPRIQLPQIPQVQMPRFQAPRVQLPQAPKIDLAAVGQALRGFQQGVDIFGRTFTGRALTPEQQRLVAQIPGGKTMLAATPRASEIGQFLRSTAPGIDLGLSIKEKGLGAFSPQAIMQRGPIAGVSQVIQKTGQRVAATPEATRLRQMPGITGELARYQQLQATKPSEAIKQPIVGGFKAAEQLPGFKQLGQTEAGKFIRENVAKPILQAYIDTAGRVGGAQFGEKTYAEGLKGYSQLASDITNVASLVYSGGLSTQLAQGGIRTFIPTAVKLAPRLAASGAGQNIIAQLAEGKKLNELDPKEIALAAGAYTALGIGVPAATKVGGAAIRKTIGAVTPTPQIAKAAQALPTDKNALVIARSIPEKGALRAQGYTNVKVQFQPKPGQVAPTVRGAIPQVAPKAPKGQEALFAEARKYKSAEEFAKQFEYHGGPDKLVGGKLSTKYDRSGGIFTTPSKDYADVFKAKAGKGKIYTAYIGDKKVIDLTTPKGADEIKKLIGTKYISDGETMIFTKQDYDFMFPNGKADWATFSSYIPLLEKKGYSGARLIENQVFNGKPVTSTSLFSDVQILPRGVTPQDIWNKANKPTLPIKPIYETAPKPGKPESFDKLIKSGQISAEEAKQVQALGMTPKDYLDMKAQPQMPFPKTAEGQMPSFMQPLKLGEVKSKFANQLEFDAGVPDKVLTDIFPGYKPLANETVYKSAVKNLNQNQESIVQNLIAGKLPSTAENNATAMIAMRRLIDAEDFKKATELAQATIAKGTDAGRAVQIFARWRATTPEGALLKAQKVVNEVNTKLPMNKKIELGREKVLKIQDIANKIQQLGEGTRERQVQEALLAKEIMDVVPPGKLRKISTLQTLAQLLNAKTAIRNILGNTGGAGGNDIAGFVGSGVDAALFKLGLVKQRSVVMPSLTTGIKGFVKGAKYGAQDVKLGIKTSGAAGGYDIQPQVFKNEVLRKLENVMGYELSVPDKAFYQRAFDMSLDNQMRAAAKSGQVVDKPTAQMIAQANEEGLYQTFQNNSGLANALVQVKHWLNAGKDFGAGDFVLKYPKTPGNIVSQGIDFTPIGIGKGVYQLVNAARTATLNPITQRQAILNIGRGLTGTGLLSLGAVLANVGIMTADKNVNKNVNALDVIQGGGPFRLNVSALQRFATGGDPAAKEGDVTVNYDWLQPNAIQLSMGANMVLAPKQKNKIGEFLDNAISSANASVNSVVEQPVLQGVSNVLSRVAGSGYGKADIVGAIADIVASAPSGFIPSILNQVGQLTDQYARETKTSDFIQEITNKVKQRIPGLRQGLPIRYDTLGAPVFQFDPTTGGNNILNVFLNPSFPRTVKDTIVTQLVDDIYNKTGSTEQFPKVVGDKVQISVNGKTETLGLNSEQISQYQQYVGTRTEEAFKKLSLDPAFRKLSPEEQAKKMSDVMSTINSAAKIELFSSKPKTIDSKTRAVLRGKNAADYTTETATPQDKYQNALDKYDEDKAAGKISRFEDVKRTKELQTLQVGSKYTNDVLDIYGLSGKQIKTLMDEKAISQDLWNQVIAYGDELVAKGLSERNKFKDKYGNIYLPGTKEKGTGKGKGKRTISLKAPRLRRISISVPKGRKVSFKQPTPTKARKSIKIKTG